MTSRKDIQSLIDEIDGILPKAGFRLPWSRRTDIASYHQLLERMRRYLVSVEQNSGTAPDESSYKSSQSEVVQQVMQAVTQEMSSLRADLQRTLQAELAELRQQRDSLVQEIRQLESKKQQINAQNRLSSAQQQFISEISQQLVNRCAESLNQQLGQIIANQTADDLESSTSRLDQTEQLLSSQERLEQIKQIQLDSDQLLKTLDNNQQVIFEALQTNLRAYQESLSQGLDKMHSLGSQGEVIFTELIERMRQQWEQDAANLFSQQISPTQLLRQTDCTNTNDSQKQENPSLSKKNSQPLPSAPESNTPGRENQGKTAQSQVTTPTTQNQQNSQEGSSAEPKVELKENEQLENFLQLDVKANDLLPLVVEERELLERSWDQELDSLFEVVYEQVSTVSTSSAESSSAVDEEQATTQSPSAEGECKRQEIDDLYKSLFLSDSLCQSLPTNESEITPEVAQTNSTELNLASSTPVAEMMGFDDRTSSLESENPLSSQVAEVLFEGISDPATLTNQEPQTDLSLDQSPQPWETLFCQTSADPSSQEQTSTSSTPEQINGENSPEDITIITALTDLFEETDPLKRNSSETIENSMAAIAEPLLTDPNPLSTDEDKYVVASPEEILLANDSSEKELNQEISLDPNTMEQLREDINKFGTSLKNSEVPETEQDKLPDPNLHQPVVAPQETREPTQPQNLLPFRKSEELLAEDWEEFVASEWSEENSPLDSVEMETTKDQSSLEPD
ncbi:MAG: hypothetical protein WA919_09330 [Coleofasciculaceae cyanobacterium]